MLCDLGSAGGAPGVLTQRQREGGGLGWAACQGCYENGPTRPGALQPPPVFPREAQSPWIRRPQGLAGEWWGEKHRGAQAGSPVPDSSTGRLAHPSAPGTPTQSQSVAAPPSRGRAKCRGGSPGQTGGLKCACPACKSTALQGPQGPDPQGPVPKGPG